MKVGQPKINTGDTLSLKQSAFSRNAQETTTEANIDQAVPDGTHTRQKGRHYPTYFDLPNTLAKLPATNVIDVHFGSDSQYTSVPVSQEENAVREHR